ncbi:acetyltransferase, GNAT family [Hyaloscypha finlandica]|nr:acetyltransferase, GNAT family [Hyaloscypha finlandica]
MNPASLPEGPLITSPPALLPTRSTSFSVIGRHITLTLLTPSHIPALYAIFGGTQNAHIFKYLPIGPYISPENLGTEISSLLESANDWIFAVIPTFRQEASKEEVLGILSLSRPLPAHHTIDLGAIFSSLLQHTTGATEAVYLLLRHCFVDLGYQRVEWRCNDRNEASKRAAVRLGFKWEGCLRREKVYKGRGRDTTVFAVVGDEWEGMRGGIERWLEEENYDEWGRQRRRLEVVSGEVMREKKA